MPLTLEVSSVMVLKVFLLEDLVVLVVVVGSNWECFREFVRAYLVDI